MKAEDANTPNDTQTGRMLQQKSPESPIDSRINPIDSRIKPD